MEDWAAQLQDGNVEAAWDRFVDRYRRFIFAAIRHYAQDHDAVMDLFARVCEVLRQDDLRRLKSYLISRPIAPSSPPGWSPSSATSPSTGLGSATAGDESPPWPSRCRRSGPSRRPGSGGAFDLGEEAVQRGAVVKPAA